MRPTDRAMILNSQAEANKACEKPGWVVIHRKPTSPSACTRRHQPWVSSSTRTGGGRHSH